MIGECIVALDDADVSLIVVTTTYDVQTITKTTQADSIACTTD